MYSSTARRLCLLALVLCATAGFAGSDKDGGWVATAKARSSSDVSLWTRYVDGAPLKAFRGATHTDRPMEQVLALLQDADAAPRWLFRCAEARILKRDDYGDTYIYMSFHGIWPVEDRDAVVRLRPEYNARTGEVRLLGSAAPDYLPPVAGKVRVPSIESSWRLTPVEGGLLRMEMTGHVDPAGVVPLWLANLVATMVPRQSLKNLQALLDDPAEIDAALVANSRSWLQGLAARAP